jgi:hypothetical protein
MVKRSKNELKGVKGQKNKSFDNQLALIFKNFIELLLKCIS